MPHPVFDARPAPPEAVPFRPLDRVPEVHPPQIAAQIDEFHRWTARA